MRELAWFIAVGGAGAGAYLAGASLLFWVGLTAPAASFLAYAITIPMVYFAQHKFTFKSDAPHRSSFPKYISTQSIGLTLATLLPMAIPAGGRTHVVLPFVVVVIVVPLINFALLKYWTFVSNGPKP